MHCPLYNILGITRATNSSAMKCLVHLQSCVDIALSVILPGFKCSKSRDRLATGHKPENARPARRCFRTGRQLADRGRSLLIGKDFFFRTTGNFVSKFPL